MLEPMPGGPKQLQRDRPRFSTGNLAANPEPTGSALYSGTALWCAFRCGSNSALAEELAVGSTTRLYYYIVPTSNNNPSEALGREPPTGGGGYVGCTEGSLCLLTSTPGHSKVST